MHAILYFCTVNIHTKYILRCIEIAEKGLGTTAPNPMVGAVIVHNKNIIGEGYTSAYGGKHAEVNAIEAVKDKSLLTESVLYVTLEPCSHHGKTPPCVDLILATKIPKVIVGVLDPNPLVSGKGITKLRTNGCEVITGILEHKCREHHKRFLTFQEKKRPYIILKWAETRDGFIAPHENERKQNPEPFWISNIYARQLAHKWRSEEQAILVGTRTVLADNPKLNVRKWTGKSPIRLVLDKDLKIDSKYHVMDGSVNTFVFTEKLVRHKTRDGVNHIPIDFSKPIAEQIIKKLFDQNISSVLIEGGTRTLQTFIDEGLWDEARIFVGNSNFKKGIKAPKIVGKSIGESSILDNTLKVYTND